MRLGRKQPAVPVRQPHGDPRTELQLQRILSLQAAVGRAQDRVTEYLAQMTAARIQQDKAANALRGNNYKGAVSTFQASNEAQQKRIREAQTATLETERYITECQEAIADLAAKLDDTDLSYLYALPPRSTP